MNIEETNEYWNTYYRKVSEVSEGLVNACMSNPQLAINNPTATLAAFYEFHDQPAHQCYWNNRFCIAIMCSLPISLQTKAAWCAVSNAVNGYWEWTTHSGFDVEAVLCHIGINFENLQHKHEGYCSLKSPFIGAIVNYFNLPTTRYGMKSELSDFEKRQREEYNRMYPHTAVL